MPLLHRRHETGATRYRMREKLFAIGDDFWIETEDGDRAFKVDGKALRVRNTFVLKDSRGEDLFRAQAKELRIRDTMKIERDGDAVATVKKALVTPLRDRFSIELADGAELKAKGNIVDHEYKIERDGDTVAEVSKRWFRVRETYGIEIAPGQDDALILAVTACIDEMEGS
ncbi:MAG TPA: LURP-one-related family protein [Solirubrobacteraceae bacterium]|nr:LURP-one-related family protein [Solirubrobacteraceae bacterium]